MSLSSQENLPLKRKNEDTETKQASPMKKQNINFEKHNGNQVKPGSDEGSLVFSDESDTEKNEKPLIKAKNKPQTKKKSSSESEASAYSDEDYESEEDSESNSESSEEWDESQRKRKKRQGNKYDSDSDY